MCPARFWNDRRLRLFELALICVLAIGGGFLKAIFLALGFPTVTAASGAEVGIFGWAYKLIQDAALIGLLWYVLLRREKSFSHIGFTWRRKDILWSIMLWIGGVIASGCLQGLLSLTGLATQNPSAAAADVSNYLFHNSISAMTILAITLNPFFEELILRGYLMTELKQMTNSVWITVTASVVIQTIPHFYQGATSAISLSGLFLVYAIYFAKTGRLVPVILAHLYCDLGSVLLYLLNAVPAPHHG